MIALKRWKEIGKFFEEKAGLNSFIYGAADEDIIAKVEKLRQNEYPALIGILPSIMGTGTNFDSMGHESTLFYYVMVPQTNMSDEEMDEAWEITLAKVRAIEEQIKLFSNNNYYREFYLVKPDTIHIDPEFNMWGLMGWSIGFEIEHAD